MYFDIKSYLKNNRNHTTKHTTQKQIKSCILSITEIN